MASTVIHVHQPHRPQGRELLEHGAHGGRRQLACALRAARSLTVSATLSRIYSGASQRRIAHPGRAPACARRAPRSPARAESRSGAHRGQSWLAIALRRARRRGPRIRCRSRPSPPVELRGVLRTAQQRLAHRAPRGRRCARKQRCTPRPCGRPGTEHPRLPARLAPGTRSVPTAATGSPPANARPWATPQAMRRPVKDPGPAPKAMPSSWRTDRPASCSSASTIGRISSEWRCPALSSRAQRLAVQPQGGRAPFRGSIEGEDVQGLAAVADRTDWHGRQLYRRKAGRASAALL